MKSSVEELDTSTFDGFMKSHTVTAVLFYAPWCFYSQQMMPAWDVASQKLKLHDPPVQLAQVDAHRYRSIGEKFGVNAFPTMKLFVDGAVFEYEGQQGRGWQSVVKWVNKHIDRDHVLNSVEDVGHFLHDNDLNVFGVFPDGFTSSAYAASTRHYEDVIFAEARGTVLSKGVAEHLSNHATLVCETIDVGPSQGSNVKEVELPRALMSCTGDPRNPQRPEWTDAFGATVTEQKLVVKRSDDPNGGWDQNLQLKCCDQESKDKVKHDIPVPSIVMFMPHDERFAKYDGDFNDFHQLDRWISSRRTPMIMRLNMETAEKILDTGPEKLPVLFLIQQTPDAALEKDVREAAKLLRGRCQVTFSGTDDQIEKRLMDMAGVDEDSLPVLTLLEVRGGGGPYHSSKKYRIPTQGLKASHVVDFVSSYEKGTLKPWLKSEPEPGADDMGPVGVLVGSTFTAMAHDPTVDVLVDFYAPWCGHCRKFEPLYKDLAKKVKHVKTLKVMKLDATRNEVEGMQIMGFPTVMLFPAHKNSEERQLTYQGNRQVDDMVKWLHQNCQLKFSDQAPVTDAPPAPISGLLDPSEEDL